jgi:hypothetical protein
MEEIEKKKPYGPIGNHQTADRSAGFTRRFSGVSELPGPGSTSPGRADLTTDPAKSVLVFPS